MSQSFYEQYAEIRATRAYHLWLSVVHDAQLSAEHDRHIYRSTACLHGEHAYCQSEINPAGRRKIPAVCKFCDARCICLCHEGDISVSKE